MHLYTPSSHIIITMPCLALCRSPYWKKRKKNLTHQSMDSIRSLKVCCGVRQQIFCDVSGWGLFVQHISQILAWIEVCGIRTPRQHLELFVVFFKPFLCSVTLCCWNKWLPSRNTLSMKGCTLSAAMFGCVLHVIVTATWKQLKWQSGRVKKTTYIKQRFPWEPIPYDAWDVVCDCILFAVYCLISIVFHCIIISSSSLPQSV